MDQYNDFEAGDKIEFLTDKGEWRPGRITFVSNQKFVINSMWGSMVKFSVKNSSRLRNPAREQIQPLANTSISGL